MQHSLQAFKPGPSAASFLLNDSRFEPPPGIVVEHLTAPRLPNASDGRERSDMFGDGRRGAPSSLRVAQVSQAGALEAQGAVQDRDESSHNSFHSFGGSDEGKDLSSLTGPQHFYIGESAITPAVVAVGQSCSRTCAENGKIGCPEASAKAKCGPRSEGFPSPVRPKIVRYPTTPEGTEIRPPLTTFTSDPGRRLTYGTSYVWECRGP